MSKFEYIQKNIRSCQTPYHFISAKQMIENYKKYATYEEIVKLNHEFSIYLDEKNINICDLEPEIENKY